MNNRQHLLLVALLATVASGRVLLPTAQQHAFQTGTAPNGTTAPRKSGDYYFDYTLNLMPKDHESEIQIYVTKQPTLDIKYGCGAGVDEHVPLFRVWNMRVSPQITISARAIQL